MSDAPEGERDPFIDLKERISYEMDKGEETANKTLENMASLINERLGDHMNDESVREFWESILTGMDEFEDDRDGSQ